MKMMNNIWKDGIFGLVVGDALGVPVEFKSRKTIQADPVTGMRSYGTHNQPMGTWSDDSSMVLATLASIKETGELNYTDIMEKFVSWYLYGEYTPFHDVFDIGKATSKAIFTYLKGTNPLHAGGDKEWDNGNGSLMRILPVCLYLIESQEEKHLSEEEAIQAIHNASALTHAHIRSQIACGIYYYLTKAIVEKEGDLIDRLQAGIDEAWDYYTNHPENNRELENNKELENYNRMTDLKEFSTLPEAAIKSSGYVVDTLEAAVWCLLNSTSYEDTVCRAVNLGDDTDTVGAVTGGLAGLYYGFDAIPIEWRNVIQKKDWIASMIEG